MLQAKGLDISIAILEEGNLIDKNYPKLPRSTKQQGK